MAIQCFQIMDKVDVDEIAYENDLFFRLEIIIELKKSWVNAGHQR